MTTDRPHVTITFEDDELGGMYVVEDEGGEFGRSTDAAGAIRYAEDLVYGPGTASDHGVAERTRNANG